ncbi:MAG: hypothetical protein LPK79_14140 [Bacteroidota bacterium]|nr:hypothetical protein [Bacteroidota bacterium]
MKLYFFVLFVFLVFLVGCSAFKHGMTQSGNRDQAIQNAILDFSNTSSLYRKDSVFSVSFYDTMGRMVLDENHEWIFGEPYEGVVAVSIIVANSRLLLTSDTKAGGKGGKGKLPTRFVEKGGKLFFWWDDEHVLTKETLSVYKKYNLLQDDEGGLVTIPDFIIDDAQKGVHYYFCKKDLSRYKKVITNKGIGYYDPPKLKCSH